MVRARKTEHSGAKNGGGHWGPREEAKALSKKSRRQFGKMEIKKKVSRPSSSIPACPYFKLTKVELAKALHTLNSLSSELDDYNISYGYDENLNEVPANHEDMSSYADVLISHSRLELEKTDTDKNWLQIAKSLGMAGSLRKMVGQFADAERLLTYSLSLIDKHNLPRKYQVQQSIRLYDVLKRTNREVEAIAGLNAIVQDCTKNKNISNYLDVAIQHLGKAQYSLGQFEVALASFQETLNLRITKGDQDLIHSTQVAIETCQLKIK